MTSCGSRIGAGQDFFVLMGIQTLSPVFIIRRAIWRTLGVAMESTTYSRTEIRDSQRIEAHEGSVDVAAMSPDGTKLATASLDGTAKLWDLLLKSR